MPGVGHIAGEQLLIQIGDGGSPETFAHSALVNTDRSIQIQVSTSSTEVPDVANPSLPATMVRAAKSVDLQITGAGVLDRTSALAFMQWALAGTSKNVRIRQNVSGAQGGWVITGPMILEEFQITGQAREKQTCTLKLAPSDVFILAASA